MDTLPEHHSNSWHDGTRAGPAALSCTGVTGMMSFFFGGIRVSRSPMDASWCSQVIYKPEDLVVGEANMIWS
jgi:hypothetical protein